MSQPVVLVDRDRRGVATVTLNRPEVNNAYDGEMIDTLAQIFSDLAGDDGLRVVIIRGNGRHFQAGADLDWIRAVSQRGASENRVVSERTAKLMRDLDAFSRPTVAIVHGGCFGGGTGLVASCDIVVAASGSMFSIAEARWRLTAAIIVPQLNAAMGARNLRRYALSCERFDAYQAQAMGLVHEV